MNKDKYRLLVGEVRSLMDDSALEVALSNKKSSVRIDGVLDLLREAVRRSSVCKFNGNPYFFGGRIYEEMSWDDFGNMVYDVMRECQLPDGDYGRVEGMIKVCRRVVGGKLLQPDNAIMVFENCVLDMRTRQTHKFGKEWVQTTQVGYKYDPEEHIFLWRQFLDEVLPDKLIQDVLQEFLGSIFVDRREAKNETMMVLRGSGSNGKSVVFETVMGILGKDNVSNFGIGSLITGSERKKNIAFINGKRLNYCSEIKAIEFGKDSDTLKALISGEPTEARPLYGDNFTAYNIPLLMANANSMPYLKDSSYGMRRRLCIIPFTIEIPKLRQNRGLAKDLEKEYPAIFNWVLAGRDRFVANGYKLSDSKELEELLDEYQSSSSSVAHFLYLTGIKCRYEDVAEIEPKWVTAQALYGRYSRWCRDRNTEPENLTKFGLIMTELGFRKRRTPDGNLYGLFGKPVVEMFKYRKARLRKEGGSYAQKIAKPYFNGHKWVAYTVEGAAKCLGIGVETLARLLKTGQLEGLYEKEKRTYVFDLEATDKVIREKGYGKSHETKKAKRVRIYKTKAEREEERRLNIAKGLLVAGDTEDTYDIPEKERSALLKAGMEEERHDNGEVLDEEDLDALLDGDNPTYDTADDEEDFEGEFYDDSELYEL